MTRVVELKDRPKSPQLQLDKAIMDFVFDFDGPHRSHLLIVYYTGHGFVHQNRIQDLIFSGYVYVSGREHVSADGRQDPA
jgi:hypothetical protein